MLSRVPCSCVYWRSSSIASRREVSVCLRCVIDSVTVPSFLLKRCHSASKIQRCVSDSIAFRCQLLPSQIHTHGCFIFFYVVIDVPIVFKKELQRSWSSSAEGSLILIGLAMSEVRCSRIRCFGLIGWSSFRCSHTCSLINSWLHLDHQWMFAGLYSQCMCFSSPLLCGCSLSVFKLVRWGAAGHILFRMHSFMLFSFVFFNCEFCVWSPSCVSLFF